MTGENNAGFYQVDQTLSTVTVKQSDLSRLMRALVVTHPPHVWLLSGPLGAGKTTLVQALGQLFGVRTAISSPTFSLQKIHQLQRQPWKQLVHMDAYRLSSPQEVAALELPELLADPDSLVVVEWPERLPQINWGRHLLITIKAGPVQNARHITIESR